MNAPLGSQNNLTTDQSRFTVILAQQIEVGSGRFLSPAVIELSSIVIENIDHARFSGNSIHLTETIEGKPVKKQIVSDIAAVKEAIAKHKGLKRGTNLFGQTVYTRPTTTASRRAKRSISRLVRKILPTNGK